ncbi:MAG TPA: WecB/TagA/CpsF family glycosyltransferase [Patescibacteria group bacterium]|nr:WecB/TagA/CpsF family glycosyltransferase [Patescibacteria group bacterium]
MKNNNQMSQNHVNILGIHVLSTTIPQLLTSLREKMAHNIKFSIVTPNPELVLASTKNPELKIALNSATFSVPDAIGLSQATKYQSLNAPSNIFLRFPVTLFQGLVVGSATFFNRDWLTKELKPIKGRVLFEKLIELANKKEWKVFFLGGIGDEAEKAAEKLRKNYKMVKIGTFKGPKLDVDGEPKSESDKNLQKEAFSLINKFSPKLLFVAFGNPKQEIWIHKNLKYLDVGGAMAVGGTLRYVAGISKLPPKWMAKAGLEWVWRLITEPYRLGRIFNAFPIFPLRIFWFKVTDR